MRRSARACIVLFTLSLLASLLPASASAAITPTPVGGRAWKVPVIRLYDATPRSYREGIDIAIREWNAANVGIRFARTANRRLAHVVVKPVRYPGNVLGRATLGATRGAFIGLDTALVAVAHEQRNGVIYNIAHRAVPETIADVMAHEMGHVLGLEHTSGCSLMLLPNARDTCPPALPTGMWDCRLIQRRDLLAATRRYGGRGVLKRQRYCRLSATPAGAVGSITVGATTRDVATSLSWRETTNSWGYVVARSAAGGDCPAGPDGGSMRSNVASAGFTDRWGEATQRVAARYCYVVWSRNGRGTLTGPTRRFVDVAVPTIDPVGSFQATVAGTTVQLSWTSPASTTAVRIYRYPADGTCVVPSGLYHVAETHGSATSASESDVWAGTWTYAAIRSDDPEDASGGYEGFTEWPSSPTCATVTVA